MAICSICARASASALNVGSPLHWASGLDVLPVGVRVTLDHRQCLVAADPFDRRQIDARLNKMGYRRMPQGMSYDLVGIQSCHLDNSPERFSDRHCVAYLRSRGGEQPRCPWLQCFDVVFQKSREMKSNRLFPCSAFSLRDIDYFPIQVHVFLADGKDLGHPHGCFQADDDEGVDLRVPVRYRAFHEAFCLLDGQVGDASGILLEPLDGCGSMCDPAPLHCLIEEVRKHRQLAVDRPPPLRSPCA